MTRIEFFNYYLKSQGCEAIPKEGINTTAMQIEIVNKKNNTYAYLALPLNDKEMNPKAIEVTIARLGIELPPDF